MAAATTLSSSSPSPSPSPSLSPSPSPSPSPSLQFINGSQRYVYATPLSFNSIFLHHRIRRLKRASASYCGFQPRRRYEAYDRFFGAYECDVVPDDDDFSDEEDERESSVDLLIRFLRSMFKKVSKRAKTASRRILPAAMSPQLVSFAVDGILILGSLSITKAFLEVICNMGGTVFTVILLIRLFWAGASFFQTYGNTFGPNPLS